MLSWQNFDMGGGDPSRAALVSTANYMVHGVVPLLAIADWILFLPHGRLHAKDAALWLIYPIAYAVLGRARRPRDGGGVLRPRQALCLFGQKTRPPHPAPHHAPPLHPPRRRAIRNAADKNKRKRGRDVRVLIFIFVWSEARRPAANPSSHRRMPPSAPTTPMAALFDPFHSANMSHYGCPRRLPPAFG